MARSRGGRSAPRRPKSIVGYFSRRSIAGSSMADAFRVVRERREEGAMATLDILGEFITSLEEADGNAAAYVDLLEKLDAEGLPETNVSVKLTALRLLIDRKACSENLPRGAAPIAWPESSP